MKALCKAIKEWRRQNKVVKMRDCCLSKSQSGKWFVHNLSNGLEVQATQREAMLIMLRGQK